MWTKIETNLDSLLRDLFQDNALILPECDKNPGWSLDTCSWYNQEYVSH